MRFVLDATLGEVAAAREVQTCKRGGGEPRSVLDNRRSPSPPTSISNLSSSLGGGVSPNDTAGVAAVSKNWFRQKWIPSGHTTSLAVNEGGRKEDLLPELHRLPISLDIGLMGSGPKCGGLGVEDWDLMLSDNPPVGAPFSRQDQSFPTWFTGNVDESSSEFTTGNAIAGGLELLYPSFLFQPINGISAPSGATSDSFSTGGGFPLTGRSNPNNNGDDRILPLPTSLSFPNGKNPPFSVNFNQIIQSPMISTVNSFPLPPAMEKPLSFNPNHMSYYHLNQGFQDPSFFSPLNLSAQQEHHKQHHISNPSCQISPKFPMSVPCQDHLLGQPQPQQEAFGLYHHIQSPVILKLAADESSDQCWRQVLLDQLFKAAELIEGGNSLDARMILARLNHQLFLHGEPLIRSAFYFKKILDTILGDDPSTGLPLAPLLKVPATLLDVVFKLNAYKYFSEICPIVQFVNFTCIQAQLEELTGCDHIHIVDFDIGVGGQWSSFIQELANRSSSAFAPSLKITAVVAPSSDHHHELLLTRANLSEFSRDLGIPFKFSISTLDSFDPSAFLNMSSSCSETIAVNIPVGLPFTSTPTILHLVKKLSPKIVLSIDHNCHRSDLSFSENFLCALHSYTVLLESIDATGSNLEMSSKIEKYLLQPRIENAMLSRHHTSAKMVPWRTLFTSAGYVPKNFSSFTETQAECLLKRIQVRGYHVKNHQGSLSLFWQSRELVSVSAWKC